MSAYLRPAVAQGTVEWQDRPKNKVFLRRQTLLNMGLNAVIPTALMLAAGARPPATLLEEGGVAQAVMTDVTIGSIITFVTVTRTIRRKIWAGELLGMRQVELRGVARWLPSGDLEALATVLLFALAIVTPIAVTVSALLRLAPLDLWSYAALNAGVGLATGACVTSNVSLRAMATPGPRPRLTRSA